MRDNEERFIVLAISAPSNNGQGQPSPESSRIVARFCQTFRQLSELQDSNHSDSHLQVKSIDCLTLFDKQQIL